MISSKQIEHNTNMAKLVRTFIEDHGFSCGSELLVASFGDSVSTYFEINIHPNRNLCAQLFVDKFDATLDIPNRLWIYPKVIHKNLHDPKSLDELVTILKEVQAEDAINNPENGMPGIAKGCHSWNKNDVRSGD